MWNDLQVHFKSTLAAVANEFQCFKLYQPVQQISNIFLQ